MKTTVIGRIVTLLSFALMVTVNALANIIPINGMNTGQVSDAYPNLFAPIALTFSIWGVIYFLLLLFVLFALGLFRAKGSRVEPPYLWKTEVLFSISSVANTAWILSWHFQIIPLSMVLTLTMLTSIALLYRGLMKVRLTMRERVLVLLPFSVYFGWLTIATIANATVLFVSLGWTGGSYQPIWMAIILVVGLAIGLLVILRNRDIAYGLVFIWAYAGILAKHALASGFSGAYPLVMITVTVCLVALVAAIIYAMLKRKPRHTIFA